MKVAIGSDHAGYQLKSELARELSRLGHEVTDLGTHGPEAVDYPDYAQAVAEAVAAGEAERGVLVCGSAVGVGVAANKVPGIRAGVCHDTYSAHQGVEHDDINVLCLGERVIGSALANEVLHSFMKARFTGEERHVRRLEKLRAIERKYLA
ncbi:MAG: ribose 5-phosphate isomerase B [Gemmatimonadota bacterium]